MLLWASERIALEQQQRAEAAKLEVARLRSLSP